MTGLIIKNENAVANPTRASFPILEIIHDAKKLSSKDYSEKSLIELNLNELSAKQETLEGVIQSRLNANSAALLIAHAVSPLSKSKEFDEIVYATAIVQILRAHAIETGNTNHEFPIPFSKEVFGIATLEIYKKYKFPPAPGEFFDELKAAHWFVTCAKNACAKLIDARHELDNRPPPPTPEEIEQAKIERAQLREIFLSERRSIMENDRRRRQEEQEAAERASRERQAAREAESAQRHAEADRRRSVMNEEGACPDREPETCRDCILRGECRQRWGRGEPDHELLQQIAAAERRLKVIEETGACSDKDPQECAACINEPTCPMTTIFDPAARAPRRPSRRSQASSEASPGA